jgi:hypothetical protein
MSLAACQRAEAPANNQQAAAPAPKAAQPESEVAKAERLVRTAIGGNVQGMTFTPPQRVLNTGVPVLCGEYRQDNARQRYIVVAGEHVFIEPRMGAGEMDRAFGEFCGGERG